MGDRKRWRRDWHHRAPDFKLVYCGPKRRGSREDVKVAINEGRGKLSVIADEGDVAGRRLEKQENLE